MVYFGKDDAASSTIDHWNNEVKCRKPRQFAECH